MTMHLSRHSMINTSRRKIKITKTKMNELVIAWRKHNKSMKQRNIHSMVYATVEEYIDYVYGRKKRKSSFTKLDSMFKDNVAYQKDQNKKYPSLNSPNQFAPALKKENNKYTGGNLVGIAIMHKSNLVPVFKKDDAKDIANMRRN